MDVVVRLVPRNRTRAPRREYFGRTNSAAIKTLTPDRTKLRSAMGEMANLGMTARETSNGRLELTLPAGEVEARFDVGVREATLESPAPGQATALQSSFAAPVGELHVPDELKNVVEFAYIPRPVEFFAPSYIPPVVDLYHLSLEEVRLVLQASRSHRNGWTGKGARVAMADTGFNLHPWFQRNGYSLVPTPSPGSGDPSIDTNGHGTGESANIFAVAPDCTVFGVKHGATTAGTLEACMDVNPHVMTHSWGWHVDNQSKDELQQNDPNFFNELVDVETVLLEAVNQGIAVFFSAGNGHLAFPASIPEVIAIGGTTVLPGPALEASNYVSSFVSQLYPGRQVPDFCGIVGSAGPQPQQAHIMLPVPEGSALEGENFPTGALATGWGIFSGTSAASPQCAGVAALMASINTKLSPETVRAILAQTAVDVTTGSTGLGDTAVPGPDLATGRGLVDAFSACEAVAAMS